METQELVMCDFGSDSRPSTWQIKNSLLEAACLEGLGGLDKLGD